MVTTNERSFIAASISAVATICAPAPSATQGQNISRRRRQRKPGRQHHAGEEQQRERKAEQEAHMGRADGAERRRQLALHGVARGLAGGGEQREDGIQSQPVSASAIHRVSRAFAPRQHVVHVHVARELPAVGEEL